MRTALGKGLNALISEDTVTSITTAAGAASTETGIRLLLIQSIDANAKQPRRHFDETALEELTSSIREKGLLQPILVAAKPEGKFEIIAGERRWRAAQRAGLKVIPALVKTGTESENFELSLIENIQRQDLNPIEQAEGYRRLQQEFGMTQERIARVMGKDRAVIANTLRLLNLPEEIRQAVIAGKITMGHARALLSLDDLNGQLALFQRILDESLSVRVTEKATQKHSPRRSTAPASEKKSLPEVQEIENDLRQRLGRKVELQLQPGAADKGMIRLEFYSLDDLDTLLAHLRRAP